MPIPSEKYWNPQTGKPREAVPVNRNGIRMLADIPGEALETLMRRRQSKKARDRDKRRRAKRRLKATI